MDMDGDEIPRLVSVRLSQSQFGSIVDFMTLNPELICYKSPSADGAKVDRSLLNKKWDELVAILNSDRTGARKTVEKWRKTWADIKCNIRNRVTKLISSARTPEAANLYLERLNDLDRRVWNLINSDKREQKTNNLKSLYINVKPRDEAQNYLKDLAKTNYILTSADGQSFVVTSIDTDNNPATKESACEMLDQSRTLNNTEVPSEGSNDAIQNLGESSEISSDCENEILVKKIIQGDNSEPIILNSSYKSPGKRLQLQNHEYLKKRRKEEASIVELLQKQNELLENISQSIARIEKSLQVNPPPRKNDKNDLVDKATENLDKIRECFDSVSECLKQMA